MRLISFTLLTFTFILSSFYASAQTSSHISIQAGGGLLIPKRLIGVQHHSGNSLSIDALYEKEFLNTGAFITGVGFQKLKLPYPKESSELQIQRQELSSINIPILLKLDFSDFLYMSLGPRAVLKIYDQNKNKLDTDLYFSLGTQHQINRLKFRISPYYSTTYYDLGIKIGISHQIK